MAYPFMKAPTYEELLARLRREYGVEVRESAINYGPRGPIRFRFLEKPGQPIFILPDAKKDSDCVAPSVVRSICTTLGLPPADFGFDLD